MVLSNKKLKQKLRAAKAELIVAAESQNNINDTLESVDSKALHPLKILMDKDTKRAKLSKREKRRQNAEHNAEDVRQKQIAGSVDEKSGVELKSSDVDKKNKKKRKRDEGETLEKVKEDKPEQPKKKKKTKNKRKSKKKSEKKQAKEEAQHQNGAQNSGEQLVVEALSSDNIIELEPSTKVYVGGIPYYSTEDDIRSYFESCGSITDIDCMEFPDTGKFRGIAIITFKTEAAAKRALALNGSDMGGLFLKIQPFKSARVASKSSNFSPVLVEGYNRIYVGNLPWDVTEDDLKKLFSDCTISSIRFGEDKDTGEFKGYAHIDFADSLSLNLALKLDQSIVCGRRVRISCAIPKKGTVSKLKTTPTENHGDGDKVRTVSSDRYISSAKVNPFNQNQDVNGAYVSTVSNDEENYTANVKAVNRDEVNSSVKVTTDSKGGENNSEVTAVSSKTRRRTCYECGEKGHISSLCPKKQAADLAIPSGGNVTAVSKDQENYSTKVCANSKDQINGNLTTESKSQESNTEVSAVSSKIRRRTCYECGEKGHISSLCPMKQAAGSANPSAA